MIKGTQALVLYVCPGSHKCVFNLEAVSARSTLTEKLVLEQIMITPD